jgi:plastocyanin
MSAPSASPKPKSGMGRVIAIIVVVIIVAAVVGGYFLLYPMNSTTKSSVNIASGTGSNQSLNFNPPTITVVIGKSNTVVFTNNDVTNHSVVFTSAPSGVSVGSISDSNIPAGASFTVTLTVAGTYQYHCIIHNWMSGTIVVNSS